MKDEPCLCIRCAKERPRDLTNPFAPMEGGFRYACEICGNKRCPHHSDHRFACTNSNEPGQKGSVL